MAHMEWTVTEMTCGHCVSAVSAAAQSVPGVSSVAVDLESATLALDIAGPDFAGAVAALVAAVQAQGYELG